MVRGLQTTLTFARRLRVAPGSVFGAVARRVAFEREILRASILDDRAVRRGAVQQLIAAVLHVQRYAAIDI